MPVTVVVGVQWGDEGKGKVVDYLARETDMVARYQGGANAGHTVKVGQEEYKLHLVPSGSVYGKECVIGNGVVLEPGLLIEEIDALRRKGHAFALHVSDRAHVVTSYHKAQDAAEEQAKGAGSVGTTRRGIGPAYADKMARLGIRVGDLLDAASLREKLAAAVPLKNAYLQALGSKETVDAAAVERELLKHGEALRPMVTDTAVLLNEAAERGKNILLEGAQGTLLDIDQGTYPYVTSSSTTAAGACIGTGLPPNRIDRVLGVMKAYTTRVGAGPFPTELPLDAGVGKHLSSVGREVGTTTGRPRRCGWLDLVLARHAVRLSGISALAVTKLDVLNGLDKVQVCVAYQLDGREVREVPGSLAAFARCKPVYEEFAGWSEVPRGAQRLDDLPRAAQRYLDAVRERLRVGLALVSVGPERGETIVAS